MTTYIIKRILLMIPTLFVISLVIFLVLNLAPGRPTAGGGGGDGMETAQSQEARESYRIFKEQFNFDKPVLFNTRFTLKQDDVLQELTYLVDYRAPICGVGEPVEGCMPRDERPGRDEVINAEDILEDWGSYIVPQLLDIAKTAERIEIRKLALAQLATNAKRRLINEYGKKQTDAERAMNKEIHAENQMVEGWKVPQDATPAQIDAVIKERWEPWLAKHNDRFDYSLGEKVAIFFTDTRFAKYWANLITLDFGVSHVDKRPVMEKIIEKVPYTLTLNFLAIFFAYVISVPLGVWSAYRQDSPADRVVTVVLFLLYSLPSFFIAVLLLQSMTKGTPFDWFPTGDFVGLPGFQPEAEPLAAQARRPAGDLCPGPGLHLHRGGRAQRRPGALLLDRGLRPGRPALAGTAGRADHRRSRRARLRGNLLVRHVCAGRHAQAGAGQAARRADQGAEPGRREEEDRRAGR